MSDKTCASTQQQARGTSQVCSSNPNLLLPKVSSSRKTRNSQKAIQPLTPVGSPSKNVNLCNLTTTPPCISTCSQVTAENSTPTTHPDQLSPVYTLPFPFPTISQLKDYPNSTPPFPQPQKSVIVSLPHSAPATPTQSFNRILSGEPKTPRQWITQ